jgi:GMP synthase PP-ATPase subunit
MREQVCARLRNAGLQFFYDASDYFLKCLDGIDQPEESEKQSDALYLKSRRIASKRRSMPGSGTLYPDVVKRRNQRNNPGNQDPP